MPRAIGMEENAGVIMCNIKSSYCPVRREIVSGLTGERAWPGPAPHDIHYTPETPKG